MFRLIADAAAPAAQTQGSPMSMLVMMVLIFGLMFFMLSRSNKKQQQKRQQMLDSIVKGSDVLLSGGIYGKVAEVKDKVLIVDIADKVSVKVDRAGVVNVIVPETGKEDAKKETSAK